MAMSVGFGPQSIKHLRRERARRSPCARRAAVRGYRHTSSAEKKFCEGEKKKKKMKKRKGGKNGWQGVWQAEQ